MSKDDFNDLLWFLAVAEERSFTKAAAKLGIPPTTLSHNIRRLETRMGIRLLTRTTRSVAPTEAGDRLAATLRPRVQEIQAEIASLMSFRDTPAGTVRLSLSDHALNSFVWPKLRVALRDYPDVKVEISRDNGLRNIVADGFDAGVRPGQMVEKDMVAVRISADWRFIAVASPDYVSANGTPDHPNQLVDHNCMNTRMTSSGGLYAWQFSMNGEEVRVRVDGQLTFNTIYPMIDAALDGYGIAYVPDDTVLEHVKSGRLVTMLEQWSPWSGGYYLYYPSRRMNSPAFQVIVDALRA